MSHANSGPRGAGVDRPGATDTTMLIWKTIEANPGITREGIFARIEHEIPAGWARRQHMKHGKIDGDKADSPSILHRARSYLLGQTLHGMRRWRSIARDDNGGYTTLRPLLMYKGNPDHIDEGGTRAADHLNRVYAERALYAVGRRWRESGSTRMTRAEAKAFMLVYGPRDDVAP